MKDPVEVRLHSLSKGNEELLKGIMQLGEACDRFGGLRVRSPQPSRGPHPPRKSLGRFCIDKQFHGALEASGKGEMLTAGNAAAPGGYVAIEKVAGQLDGRKGTFIVQHSAFMDRGRPQMSVSVVPNSGTGALIGISGKMDIIVEGGKHSYVFEFTVPENHYWTSSWIPSESEGGMATPPNHPATDRKLRGEV